MAKLKISVGRTIGRPNYGSIRCDIGVEIDLDETLFATEDDFQAEISRATSKCRAAMSDELVRLAEIDKAEAAALAEERRESEAQSRGSYDRTPATDAPARRERGGYDRGSSRGSSRGDGKPKTGAGLFKKCMELKDAGDDEPMHRVDVWAKRRKLPQKWKDWEPEEVEEACEVAGF